MSGDPATTADPPEPTDAQPSTWLDRATDRLIRYRAFALGCIALGVVIALAGASQLRADFNLQRMFESDDADYAFLDTMSQAFGPDDMMMVVYVRRDHGLFTFDGADYLTRAHAAVTALDEVHRVDDLTAVHLPQWIDGLPLLLPLIPVPPNAADAEAVADYERTLAESRTRALDDPMLGGRILGGDADATVLLVHLSIDVADIEKMRPAVNRVVDTLDALPRADGIELHITGIPVVRARVVDRIIADQMLFIPLCGLLFTIVLWLLFRDIRAVLVPLVAVAISVIYMAGTLGATGEPINVINAILVTLIFVIGISDAIHLVARYRRELAKGLSPLAALHVSITHLTIACFLTSFTTAIGFASLLVAKLNVLRSFGLYAAVGVMMAYVVTVVFVPLAFSLLRHKLPPAANRVDRRLDAIAERIGAPSLKHPWIVIAIGMTLLITAGVLASGLVVESNLYESFNEGDPIMIANEHIERDFGGVVPVSIVFEWDEGGSVMTPDALVYMREIEIEFESQPDIGGAYSIADMIEQWHQVTEPMRRARGRNDRATQTQRSDRGSTTKADTDDIAARFPTTARECERGLDIISGTLSAQNRSDVLDRVYMPDQRIARIVAMSGDIGARAMAERVASIEARFARDADRLRAMGLRVRVTGTGIVISSILDRLIRDLLASLLVAFAFIFVTMIVLLRSIRSALICMVPNVAPMILTFGVMSATGMELRIGSVIVFSVALGLAVDDTIHFMARFKEEWRNLGRAEDDSRTRDERYRIALQATLHGAGNAIVTTTVLLLAGFGVLMLSLFPITREFAIGMTVTIAGALIGDLLLLPALLLVFKPIR